MGDIASRLHPPNTAQTDALTLFGLMLGTLQLARTLTDRNQSDQLLDRGVGDGHEAAERLGVTALQMARSAGTHA